MLLFHIGGLLLLYALLRFQAISAVNPAGQTAVTGGIVIQYGDKLHHEYELAELWGRKHAFLPHADARPDTAEFPVGGDRYRVGHGPHSRLRPHLRKDGR